MHLSEAFKHLLKYGDVNSAGEPQWRFALHPRFPYWALNMKQRHQVLSQAKIYLRQNPGDAHISFEELREMVGNLRGEQLMKRIQRYAAKILGSSQYWFQRYLELSALLEQVGTPTFFWTVSSADVYWPDLHSLLSTQTTTHQDRLSAIINHPHLTD